jgi:hypothetical protein
MDDALRQLVWQRAGGRCEYCQLAQEFSILPFEIDHIIARKHGGKTLASNLALACYYDNSFKGSDIASIDPYSGKLTGLYRRGGNVGHGTSAGTARSWSAAPPSAARQPCCCRLTTRSASNSALP